MAACTPAFKRVAVRSPGVHPPRGIWQADEGRTSDGDDASMSKAQVHRLGRQLSRFVGLWAVALAALFVVATLIRLATAS